MADLRFLVDDWPTLDRLLDAALLEPADSRDAWMESLPESDAVKSRLRFLLRAGASAAAEGDDFLGELPRMTLPRSGPGSHGQAAEAVAGAMIGPYRLIRQLGVGGMGVVWLAERHDHGLKRPVALKLPHMSWTHDLAARMDRERDILARLDHPNIAQIFDAGVDAAGRPYLALEYVDGEPIDAYCQRLALSIPQRLELVLQVARAVAHAHARLVVHRDLKPANILVTPAGAVQLLDFGIAKLLEGESTRETELTRVGGRALTLDYASPEQVRGDPLGTGSDVYSLGVVTYVLLTGSKPYQLKRQTAAALEEAIASVEVRPASAAAPDTATQRALKGDVDAILNRALKKDIRQRYPTVEALAQDIERHMSHRPVLAQPDSLGYRARTFLRRNRTPVAAATVTAIALTAGLAAALWQGHEARAQARRAEAVQAFIKQIFTASDPEQAQGRDVSARDLLRRGATRLETDLRGQPEVQADLQHEIGDILLAQGANADAKPHFEKAIALYERLGTGDTDPAVAARLALSDVLINESQFIAAASLAEESLAIATHRGGPAPRWALHASSNLAFIRTQQGQPQRAVEALERALENHRRSGYGSSAATADALSDVGHAYMAMERYEAARDAYAQSVVEVGSAPDRTIRQQLIATMYLQYARHFLHEDDAIARDLPGIVDRMERHLGAEAGVTLSARTLWAQVLVAGAQYDQGLKLLRDNVALSETRKTLGGDALAFQRGVLAKLLQQSGRYDEGLRAAESAVAFTDAQQAPPNWRAEVFRIALGELQRDTGHPEVAVRTLSLAQQRVGTLAGHEQSPRYATLLRSLALAEHDLGLGEAAAGHMADALAIFDARPLGTP